eukprot:Awhi_evm1s11826
MLTKKIFPHSTVLQECQNLYSSQEILEFQNRPICDTTSLKNRHFMNSSHKYISNSRVTIEPQPQQQTKADEPPSSPYSNSQSFSVPWSSHPKNPIDEENDAKEEFITRCAWELLSLRKPRITSAIETELGQKNDSRNDGTTSGTSTTPDTRNKVLTYVERNDTLERNHQNLTITDISSKIDKMPSVINDCSKRPRIAAEKSDKDETKKEKIIEKREINRENMIERQKEMKLLEDDKESRPERMQTRTRTSYYASLRSKGRKNKRSGKQRKKHAILKNPKKIEPLEPLFILATPPTTPPANFEPIPRSSPGIEKDIDEQDKIRNSTLELQNYIPYSCEVHQETEAFHSNSTDGCINDTSSPNRNNENNENRHDFGLNFNVNAHNSTHNSTCNNTDNNTDTTSRVKRNSYSNKYRDFHNVLQTQMERKKQKFSEKTKKTFLIPRGVSDIEDVVKQWEVGVPPYCPPLRDWTVSMRRQERSLFSKRKRLYREYEQVGRCFKRFHSKWKNIPIGQIYAQLSGSNKRTNTRKEE